MNAPQTAADLDRIRSREDDRILDALYMQAGNPDEDAEALSAEEQAERIDNALSEIKDVQRCEKLGSLDYDTAAGVLIEYLPEIISSLETVQEGAQRSELIADLRLEVSRLKSEVIDPTFADELFKAANRAREAS